MVTYFVQLVYLASCKNYQYIARMKDMIITGVDEAGRGPLAGPVVAAAVILPAQYELPKLTDSKKLSEKQRESLFEQIHSVAIAVGVGRAEVAEIDQINILQATMKAMQRAVEALSVTPELALIDGNRCPDLHCRSQAIIKGDLKEPCISAASIIAKVTRDREMLLLEEQYPGYGFAKHKGYGTKVHVDAIKSLGPTPVHRRSFAPVREMV